MVLARRAGVSRQALIAIEAGRQVPSTALALRLAAILCCRVEDLFRLPATPELTAEWADVPSVEAGGRVVVGRPGGRWVAHSLGPDDSRAADAVAVPGAGPSRRASLTPLYPASELAQNLLVAGCAPLLGVLAQRRNAGGGAGQTRWLPANSSRALTWLRKGFVHVAGVHLTDPRTGDSLPLLRRKVPDRALEVINLAVWRQGLLVPRGNPLAIRGVEDLCRPALRCVQRDRGSGAQSLLQRLLPRGMGGKMGTSATVARGHLQVAQQVACGAADVGVAIEAAALSAGLDFVPLNEERFDLVVASDSLEAGPVQRLFDVISTGTFRTEISHTPGYDASLVGKRWSLEVA